MSWFRITDEDLAAIKACDSLLPLYMRIVEARTNATDCSAEIARARDEYCNDECEIDDDCAVSIADEGVWVQAWVWVYRPQEEDE